MHDEELRDRLMEAFGHRRAGAKIVERLDRALTTFQGASGVDHNDVWWRLTEKPVVPRHRSEDASADRISPREYKAAVVAALEANETLNDEELVSVLRDAFGFGSASARLRTEVHSAAQALMVEGTLVHASSGYALKGRPVSAPPQSGAPKPGPPPLPIASGAKPAVTSSLTKQLIDELRSMGCEVIDKTDSRGPLWVVGGQTLGEKLQRLERHGVRFTFAKNGSGSTSERPGWYWKPAQ
jgi:hypothetical protein